MIKINYKSKLVFYSYIKKQYVRQRNENIKKKKCSYDEFMTQERYAKYILFIVQTRKEELIRENKSFIF